MYNINKSPSIKLLSVFLCIFFLATLSLQAVAEENYGNILLDSNDPNMIMYMSSMGDVNLPFDPNDYSFLIYVPNGEQDSIEEAMDHLGISCDKRSSSNVVTSNDLETHDILIVGWNAGGYTSAGTAYPFGRIMSATA